MKKLLLIFRFSAIALIGAAVLFLHTKCSDDNDIEPNLLGELSVFPQQILVNTNTEIRATVRIPSGLEVGDTIRLIDTTGGGSAEVGYLVDSGDLQRDGDEIKGDGIYSGLFTIFESDAGQMTFVAKGQIVDGDEIRSTPATVAVFDNLPTGSMNDLLTTQNNIADQLNAFLGGSQANTEQAVSQLVQWLETQPGVENVNHTGPTSVEIVYESGIRGGAIISKQDEHGTTITRGGGTTRPDEFRQRRSETPVVPLEKQTRGISVDESTLKSTFDPNTIGNRNVFIYAPFEWEFAPWNERGHIINILDSVACGEFSVTSYVNQQATVGRLYEMVNYGTVVIATHGADGNLIMTGEVVDTTQTVYNSYVPLMQGDDPQMGIYGNFTISYDGQASFNGSVYTVFAPFIASMPGTFPQSVILNNSCESTKTNRLQNAFIAKGAKTYFGYSEVVPSDFCIYRSRDFFIELAQQNKTTGNISSINSSSGPPDNAVFGLGGSTTMKYSLDLINGIFDYGLLGWTKVGDGRVISQLAFLTPQKGPNMGIISTGMGFTQSMGSISQTLRLPDNASQLSFKWNFLSEEFLEYIGSQYQDTFQVVIINEEGVWDVIMIRTIDGIAAEFGASAPSDEYPDGIAGDLISVSPEISFDRGDVYMTGWQSSSLDISSYQGQCVTLMFRATDVGDSIYDTAVLLDDIEIK